MPLVDTHTHTHVHKRTCVHTHTHTGPSAATLQAADWKRARRWRLLVADSGALSFADLTFRRSQASSTGGHDIGSVDDSRLIAGQLLLLTWPPDGRYAPLTASASAAVGGTGGLLQPTSTSSSGQLVLPVRVLVSPLNGEADAAMDQPAAGSEQQQQQLTSAHVRWACKKAGQRTPANLVVVAAGAEPDGSRSSSVGSAALRPFVQQGTPNAAATGATVAGVWTPSPDAPLTLSSATLLGTELSLEDVAALTSSCGWDGVLLLQAVVTDSAGRTSTSELRPLLLHSLQAPLQQAGGGDRGRGRGVGSTTVPRPLQPPASLLELLLLRLDTSLLARWLFLAGWLSQTVGLLVLPR